MIEELNIAFVDGQTILGEEQFIPMRNKINELVRAFNASQPEPQEYSLMELLAPELKVGKKISGWAASPQNDAAKCTISRTSFADYIGDFTQIKIVVKDGYDFCFGVGTYSAGKFSVNGATTTTIGWNTNTQEVTMPISADNCYVVMSFRYDDTTSAFPSGVTLADLVEKIVLIP